MTSCFDAVVDFSPQQEKKSFQALMVVKNTRMPCSLSFYPQVQKGNQPDFFIRVHTRNLLNLKWDDRFEVRKSRKNESMGQGRVLNPDSGKVTPKKINKRIAYLQKLNGNEKEMLLALLQHTGTRGLKEREIAEFSPLSKQKALRLSQELEQEGRVRILSFSPLFLLSRESLDFLGEKILAGLSRFHEKHPGEEGMALERIKRGFRLDHKILSLAINRLLREDKIKKVHGRISLGGFRRDLFPEEEKILQKLEMMCYQGEFRSVSFDQLCQKFHLSPQRLDMLLSFLMERRKIVQGKNGFIIHSRWLDEIISRIRSTGKKEISVSDFKKMTGLSRKYAIPLLELLDQMGVTRRRGAGREIL
ncbi:MAG: SelB C-terminal domain-containing protein [Candidatus Aminicenantes bacterium]